MNGWLMLWLGMVAFGVLAFLSAIAYERRNRGVFEGLPAVLITYACVAISGWGLFFTLVWLIAWGFES